MQEIIFLVEESEEGGYLAKGLSDSIYTEADSIEELKQAVKDAIQCHFDDENPKLVRFHLVREEVFSV